MDSVVIRPATLADVPALHPLFQQLDDIHAVAEPDVVPTHDLAPRATADLEALVRDDHVLVAVAAAGQGEAEAVIGFAHIRIVHLGDAFLFHAVPEVENLAVLESRRGRGVGRQLMQAAEDWARESGYPEIWVTAWSFNEPAAGLYRGQGFRPLSTRFRKPLVDQPPAESADPA